MRESGRERECWDMKGSPSSTQQSNDWGILMKKVPEAKERMFFKRSWCNAWCSHRTSNCIRSPQTEWTPPNSWAIGKNIQKTLVTVLGISNLPKKITKGRSKGIKPFTSHSNVPQIKLKKICRNTKTASAPKWETLTMLGLQSKDASHAKRQENDR